MRRKTNFSTPFSSGKNINAHFTPEKTGSTYIVNIITEITHDEDNDDHDYDESSYAVSVSVYLSS